MQNEKHLKQAELLLRVLPHISRERVFALKGGTAINFFWRNYPRLSVDIDLTYLKAQNREFSLTEINDTLNSIEKRLQSTFKGIHIKRKQIGGKICAALDRQYPRDLF